MGQSQSSTSLLLLSLPALALIVYSLSSLRSESGVSRRRGGARGASVDDVERRLSTQAEADLRRLVESEYKLRVYLAPGCGFCTMQKRSLAGFAWPAVEQVDCGRPDEKCEGLTAFPTWEATHLKTGAVRRAPGLKTRASVLEWLQS
jgi:hypothetical protein